MLNSPVRLRFRVDFSSHVLTRGHCSLKISRTFASVTLSEIDTRVQTHVSSLDMDEEASRRAKRLRELRYQASSAISLLNKSPASELASRITSLKKDLDIVDLEKLKTLDDELEEFMLQHMQLSSQEIEGRPWSKLSKSPDATESQSDNKSSYKVASTSSTSLLGSFPFLKPTPDYKMYSSQELFLRHLAHSRHTGALGSKLEDVYRPRDEIRKPRSIDGVTVSTLLAAGCHIGHAKASWRNSTQYFIYGQYNGILIIDLNETMVALKRACSVIRGVSRKAGVVLYVGTSRNWEQLLKLEEAAKRSSGYYVSKRWIPGMITNFVEVTKQIKGNVVTELNMANEETGRDFSNWEKSLLKPDLVVILNPVENRNLINECAKLRIPTIGLCDTNMEPSLLTYPIPCNDDSPRAVSTILGILSTSGQEGKDERIALVNEYNQNRKQQNSKAFKAEAGNMRSRNYSAATTR